MHRQMTICSRERTMILASKDKSLVPGCMHSQFHLWVCSWMTVTSESQFVSWDVRLWSSHLPALWCRGVLKWCVVKVSDIGYREGRFSIKACCHRTQLPLCTQVPSRLDPPVLLSSVVKRTDDKTMVGVSASLSSRKSASYVLQRLPKQSRWCNAAAILGCAVKEYSLTDHDACKLLHSCTP